jgi:hypothetical protein
MNFHLQSFGPALGLRSCPFFHPAYTLHNTDRFQYPLCRKHPTRTCHLYILLSTYTDVYRTYPQVRRISMVNATKLNNSLIS